MKTLFFLVVSTLWIVSCAEGNFAGDSGKIFKKASDGKCKPTPTNPCTGSPGTSGNPNGGGDNPLEANDGGKAILSRTFASFYFSGDRPGACSEDAKCGLGAQPCEPGSIDAVANGILGDCSPNRANCFGNRKFCKSLGKLPNDRIAIDFHFFPDQACPPGWEGGGPIPGQRHHELGYRLDRWGYYSFCRQTIPISQAVSKVTKVVTDIRLDDAGRRHATPLPCPAGYQEAGVLTDCVNAKGITPDNSPNCSGQVRVCKKFEFVP